MPPQITHEISHESVSLEFSSSSSSSSSSSEPDSTFFARFYSMQFSGKAKVRDAIAHKDLGTMDGQGELTVASHHVRVVVLTPTEAPAADDAAWAAKWKGQGIRYPLSRKVREASRA